MATAYTQKLDTIQQRAAAQLAPLSFSEARSELQSPHYRWRDASHQLSIGPVRKIGPPTPLSTDLYGYFTINFGIYVAEAMPEFSPRTKYVTEPDCMIRARIGHVLGTEDLWWSLAGEEAAIADEVVPLILGPGLAFLDRFQSRDRIIKEWVTYADRSNLSYRARVDVALILANQGELEHSARILEEHLRLSSPHPSHVQYVLDLGKKLGLRALSV
jgi:hypothetical protein